jgi:hypothetical protein
MDPITMGMVFTLGAGATQAAGTIMSGNAAKVGSDFEAKQLEQQAGESRAAAQRAAMDKRREERYAQSALLARAAASGGGADDAGVVDLAGDIAQRGEYEALAEIFKGESRARGMEDAAFGKRRSGKAAQKGAYLSAAGTILGSAGSMYRLYAGNPGAIDDDPWRGIRKPAPYSNGQYG